VSRTAPKGAGGGSLAYSEGCRPPIPRRLEKVAGFRSESVAGLGRNTQFPPAALVRRCGLKGRPLKKAKRYKARDMLSECDFIQGVRGICQALRERSNIIVLSPDMTKVFRTSGP
jgi:hypothetical protein